MRHVPPVRISSWLVLALLLFACGCQNAAHAPSPADIAFTRRHAVLREAPSPEASPVLSVGPNVQLTILGRSGEYLRVHVDNVGVTGWIEAWALNDAPVREKNATRRPRASRPKPQAAKPAPVSPPDTAKAAEAPESQAATPVPAPATPVPAQAAAKPDQPQTAPAPTPTPTSSKPAPAVKPTPTPASAPTSPSRRQANPEAFDPF